MTTQARVRCPQCGCEVSVNLNNRLHPHGWPRCKGSRLSVNSLEGQMTTDEINALAVFNSEVARGIMHTEEYRLKMGVLQKRYQEMIQRKTS
jgi:hypothetical protein